MILVGNICEPGNEGGAWDTSDVTHERVSVSRGWLSHAMVTVQADDNWYLIVMLSECV